jgi:hypothetical protein
MYLRTPSGSEVRRALKSSEELQNHPTAHVLTRLDGTAPLGKRMTSNTNYLKKKQKLVGDDLPMDFVFDIYREGAEKCHRCLS